MRTADAADGSVPAPTPAARSVRGFLLAVTLGFVVLTATPTAMAWLRADDSLRFTGLVNNVYDQTYYAASERGEALGLPRANRFTSEEDAPGPISPLYPGLGAVERAVGLPPTSLYHAPKVLVALLLPAALWWCAGLVHPGDDRARRWAVVLALFGAGLAAVAGGAVARRSADHSVIELVPVLSVAIMPHFAVAYLGLALVWGAAMLALARRGLVPSCGAAAAGGLLLGLSHGFLLLPFAAGCAVVGAGLLLRRDLHRFLNLLITATLAVLSAAPFLVLLSREQRRFEELQGQAFPARPSGAWWTWVLAMPVLSVLLVIALPVLLAARRKVGAATWLVATWLAAQGALVFLPVTVFQRRYSEGIVLPAALLASLGVARLLENRSLALRIALACLLAGPSLSLAVRAGRNPLLVGRDTDELMSALSADDIVLAGFNLSWPLPALSPATAYLGRPVETLHYEEKRVAAASYMQEPGSDASRSWFAASGITALILDGNDPSLPGLGPGACFTATSYGRDLQLLRPAPGCAGRG